MQQLQQTVFLFAVLLTAPGFAADPAPATPSAPPAEAARPYMPPPRQVRCQPTINVWVEPDVSKIPAYELGGTDARKRMPLNLLSSAPYRGDSVICNYASRSRDVTTSYSLRCNMPRRDRVYRHTYSCG
jgi:hypothetical protein